MLKLSRSIGSGSSFTLTRVLQPSISLPFRGSSDQLPDHIGRRDDFILHPQDWVRSLCHGRHADALHLLADAPGDYFGQASKLSGAGFSDMHSVLWP